MRKLEINNILLYIVLILITELNGSQIIMSTTDKFLNIYVFNKHGGKLFDNLMIKTNIRSTFDNGFKVL